MSTSELKDLLSTQKIIAPGVFDALSARLVEQAGFPAVFLTGYGVSASLLGKPDLGLITSVELTGVISAITKVVKIPVIADADTGYGGPLNVMRTVEMYERAGASAVQLEDQQWPKRCGHVGGKQVIPAEEMVAKIQAAAETRSSSNTLIIARTDAIAVEGFESALRRCELYLKAGADVLFVEGPETMEQMAAIPRLLPALHLINMAETGKTPQCTAREVWDMGYNIAIYPITALLLAVKAMLKGLQSLSENHTSRQLSEEMLTFAEFNNLIGMTEGKDIDNNYLQKAMALVNKPQEEMRCRY